MRSDETKELIVGIDLGTTFSLIAYVDAAGPHVVRDERGDGRVPSVIGVTPDADGRPRVSVGWEARSHAVENPRATVYSIKRLIGKGLQDIERELPFLAYAVGRGPRNTVRVEINGRSYSPEEISAVILRELKVRAERQLGRSVHKAVITAPAYFNDAQRQATRDAGRAAGLEVVRIINEPTAAALAYGIGLRKGRRDAGTKGQREGTSAPGATTRAERSPSAPLPQPRCHDGRVRDSVTSPGPASGNQDPETVAVYDLGGGTFDISILRIEEGVFQVLATCGDTHLGGDDFDRTLIELVTRETREQFGISIDSPATRQALRGLAEAAKVRLSDQPHADLELDLGGGRVYQRRVARGEFEAAVAPLVERTLALSRQALRDAGVDAGGLDEIVLVGGATRMPLVRRRVAEFFGRPPYTALNPDEVVAVGAAMQASVLAGQDLGLLLLDVTPLSLGIETLGGAVGKLILRNATIPCRATEMFTTFVDGQTAIKLNVLQGERELAADCRSLGEFELRGIPPMPAGIPKVEVEFLLDANGILNVSARELRSGVQAGIQVVPAHGLTRAEVDRMAQEGVLHARQDLGAHRRIDLRNQVEFDTHKTEQMLARVGHLLDDHERDQLRGEIAALRSLAQETDDLDALHRALDAFGKRTVRLAEIGITETLKAER